MEERREGEQGSFTGAGEGETGERSGRGQFGRRQDSGCMRRSGAGRRVSGRVGACPAVRSHSPVQELPASFPSPPGPWPRILDWVMTFQTGRSPDKAG